MLFKKEHVDMIKKGQKTATRRDWQRKMAKEGGVYPVQTKMFQPKSEVDVFIEVTDIWTEKLKDMTEQDAYREGHYTLEEFKQIWIDINGEWDDELEVYAINFKVHKVDRTLWKSIVFNFEMIKNSFKHVMLYTVFKGMFG